MAEYVRRRRPPASHPYWTRLHDRAHPPPLVTPVAIPAALGLAIGLYGGLKPTFTMAEAVKTAGTLAAYLAGATFLIAVPVLLFDASRQSPQRERWAATVIGGTAIAAVVFVVGLIGLVPLLAWYSFCAGQGPWLGMLTGAMIGAVPGALLAVHARRRWRERQRHWPRWERMRASRSRTMLTVNPIPAADVTPLADPAPASEESSPGRARSEAE